MTLTPDLDAPPDSGPCPIGNCDWDAEGTLNDHLFTQHDEEELSTALVQAVLENDRLRASLVAVRAFADRDQDGATCPHNVTSQLRRILTVLPAKEG